MTRARVIAGALLLTGRTLAAVVGLGIVSLIDAPSRLWLALALICWLVAVQSAFSRMNLSLAPLGASAPAAFGSIVGSTTAAAVALALPGSQVSAAAIGAATVAVGGLAWAWESAFKRWLAPTRSVVIVGWSPVAAELALTCQSAGHKIVGVAVDNIPRELAERQSTLIISPLDQLGPLLRRTRPDVVVMALSHGRLEIVTTLLDNAHVGYKVLEAPQFFEYLFGRVPVSDLPRAWFLGLVHLYRQPYSLTAKRGLDVGLALLGSVIALPLVPLVALLVKTSRGPILFRQVRVGEHGVPFTLYKFRTMRFDAEASGDAVWSVRGDDRITLAGRFLRASRLDEIPQLWNILRGSMSVVGPRPERPEFIEVLETHAPFWSRRHLVKPGLTGWAQIRAGYTADVDEALGKLSHDLWYLRHRSLIVDLAIIVKTIGVIGRGLVYMSAPSTPHASTRDEVPPASSTHAGAA